MVWFGAICGVGASQIAFIGAFVAIFDCVNQKAIPRMFMLEGQLSAMWIAHFSVANTIVISHFLIERIEDEHSCQDRQAGVGTIGRQLARRSGCAREHLVGPRHWRAVAGSGFACLVQLGVSPDSFIQASSAIC